MERRPVNPWTWSLGFAFNQAELIQGQRRLLVCSGQTATDADTAVARAAEAGGTAGAPEDFVYGRMATITDPFGAEFSVGSRPEAQRV
jgi:predicted enzyme related to lactoylglutathione lyase